MDILTEIAARTKERVAAKKKALPPEQLRRAAEAISAETGFPFEKALSRAGLTFICEVKKASPSKGIITEDFPYVQIARDYEAAGAGAVSVLTEPSYFQGDDQHLEEISKNVSLPLLRKDFTVDSYMLYEAKRMGASAVLLICAILEAGALQAYIQTASALGLSALVEAHTESEVEMALKAGARIIGVNNRDLKTFQVDMTTSERLRRLVPEDILFVSESGVREPEDVARLRRLGVNGVLVGEAFMRSTDKRAELARLLGGDYD